MSNGSFPADLVRDVANRRTFAIISHPDAGKTTLTEKLLLFGGAIQLAGTVKASSDAKLVLGAHPHVLGGVSTPAARTLVAWTLGNFVFPSGSVTARTAILHVALGADGVRGYRLVPVRIDGFRPRLAPAAQQG